MRRWVSTHSLSMETKKNSPIEVRDFSELSHHSGFVSVHGRSQIVPVSSTRPKRESFLPFGAPRLTEEEIAEVVMTLRSGWLGTGPRTAQFEAAFAEAHDAPYALAVGSCTAALHLALIGAELGPGDEVITTPVTFCATVNSILHTGATPVLADVRPDGNIDPDAIEAAITPRTRAILPVHFAGRPCDLDRIPAIAEKHGLRIIEDCAHAVEGTHRGQALGTFGDFGCFSFYVTKNLTTGEGGMLLGKDEEAMDRLRTLSLHGMDKHAWQRFGGNGYRHYEVVEAGFKYNMTDVQASIGLRQLERLPAYFERREEIWRTYDSAFADLPIGLPGPVSEYQTHSKHLYTLSVPADLRDEMLDAFTERRIGTGVHYVSLPEHPFYQERLGWHPDAFPNARDFGRQTLSIPLTPHLGPDDVEDVVWATRDVIGSFLGER